jgi:hypothetical protein
MRLHGHETDEQHGERAEWNRQLYGTELPRRPSGSGPPRRAITRSHGTQPPGGRPRHEDHDARVFDHPWKVPGEQPGDEPLHQGVGGGQQPAEHEDDRHGQRRAHGRRGDVAPVTSPGGPGAGKLLGR